MASAQRRLRRSPALALGAFVLLLLALVAVLSHGTLHGSMLTASGARWLDGSSTAPTRPVRRPLVHGSPAPTRLQSAGSGAGAMPGWLGIAALVVLGVVVVALLIARYRRGLRPGGGAVLTPEVAVEPEAATSRGALRSAVDRSLEEVRSDPNPRRAIIGAYRLMEVALGRAGLARGPAEAPREFLARALGALQVQPAAPRRLTALFERARFDHAELDLRLRDEAIEALLALRREL